MSRTTDTLAREALEAFAETLEAAGFHVYRPGRRWTFLGFGREVDGRICTATVQAGDFGAWDDWKWHMNIVPSRAHGSSMWLPEVPDGTPLSLEAAEQVTQPTGWNNVVGRQQSAGWPSHWKAA